MQEPVAPEACAACGQQIVGEDGAPRASTHACRNDECPNGGSLHSPIMCDAVWMPLDGLTFCGEACIHVRNEALLLGAARDRDEAAAGTLPIIRRPLVNDRQDQESGSGAERPSACASEDPPSVRACVQYRKRAHVSDALFDVVRHTEWRTDMLGKWCVY